MRKERECVREGASLVMVGAEKLAPRFGAQCGIAVLLVTTSGEQTHLHFYSWEEATVGFDTACSNFADLQLR
jgi:hypothetical protein